MSLPPNNTSSNIVSIYTNVCLFLGSRGLEPSIFGVLPLLSGFNRHRKPYMAQGLARHLGFLQGGKYLMFVAEEIRVSLNIFKKKQRMNLLLCPQMFPQKAAGAFGPGSQEGFTGPRIKFKSRFLLPNSIF